MKRYEKKLKAWAQRREEIGARKATGISYAEIAKELGISRQRVYQILNPERKRSPRPANSL